jgi:hypothetical protein
VTDVPEPAAFRDGRLRWDARGVANVAVLLGLVLLIGMVGAFVRWRRRSFVPQRGTSIGADLGVLSDQPRVRVREVSMEGPDRVRLVLTPEADAGDGPVREPSPDLDFVVALGPDNGGFDLLHEWRRSASPLAIVIPPGSRLLRLRSIDSLQPLTLRRLDSG